MDYLKEFISKLHNLDKARRVNEVFKDFLILCTCSLAQPLLFAGDKRARISKADGFSPLPASRFHQSDEIEQRYLNTVKQYTKEQAEEFSKLLAFLVMALEEKHQDFLGQVYMQLNLGNSATGQFFTPYLVSKMMSEIGFTDIEKQLEEKDFITLAEPCCGSGGMIIAYAETLKEHGYNYQNQLFVEAIDIDEMCFMMTYIQLSLLGVGARVMHGDSLSWKFQQVLYTPFYFINGMYSKLKQAKQEEFKPKTVIETDTQLKLFEVW